MRTFFLFLTMSIFVTAHAENEVIGTVELSIDGEDQKWYVLESPDGLRQNALWLETGPDSFAISVTAFASPDLKLVPHEAMNSAVPEDSAPALIVSIAFPSMATEHVHTLPIPATEGPAVIMILNDWSNPIDSMTLSDGPGEIRLASINIRKDSPSSFTGTFNGVMKDGEGNTRTIDAGRFEFNQVEFFERP